MSLYPTQSTNTVTISVATEADLTPLNEYPKGTIAELANGDFFISKSNGTWKPMGEGGGSGTIGDATEVSAGAVMLATEEEVDSAWSLSSNDIVRASLLNIRKDPTSGGITFRPSATASGVNSFAIGSDTTVSGEHSISFAENSVIEETAIHSYTMGRNARAKGLHSKAFGKDSVTEIGAESSFALGEASLTQGINSIALGKSANAVGDYSLAGGLASKTEGEGAVALGMRSASSNGSIAIGPDVKAKPAATSQKAVEIGISDATTGRKGNIRISEDGQVAQTYVVSDDAPNASTAPVGEEINGNLAEGMCAIRLTSNNTVVLDFNIGGTIQSVVIGNTLPQP